MLPIVVCECPGVRCKLLVLVKFVELEMFVRSKLECCSVMFEQWFDFKFVKLEAFELSNCKVNIYYFTNKLVGVVR